MYSPSGQHMLKHVKWKCTHSQAIQDVDEFVCSSEQIWYNLSLHHLLCSEWVPSEWESKQLIQHHNKHHSSPSVSVLWSEKQHVCKKKIHQDIFNFKRYLWPKCPQSITLPPVKKYILCFLSHQNPPTYLFPIVNCAWSVHICLLIQIRCLFHWRNQHYG